MSFVQGPLRAHRADVGAHAAHRGVDRGGCDRRVTTRDRGVSRVLAVLGVSGLCVTSRVERRRLNTHPSGVSSKPRAIVWFSLSLPPSSLAHHREFQVVDNISVYPNVLLGTLSDLMMCEGGRRVIARGHDADVGLFLHIVPPDGKLLSSLARHRDRHVVILLLHHVGRMFSSCRARADLKDHRVERTHHVRV